MDAIHQCMLVTRGAALRRFLSCGKLVAVVLACGVMGCLPPGRNPSNTGSACGDASVTDVTSAEYQELPHWASHQLEREVKCSIQLNGTMRCGNHTPAHIAMSFQEAKDLTAAHDCRDWEFTGNLRKKDDQ